MSFKWLRPLACGALLASLAACGGTGSSGSNMDSGSGGSTAQSGYVPLMLSDAPTDDWATIGVKVLSIALVPQAGAANVTVYSVDEASAPYVNLVELDQLSEILGNVAVPVGTYTGVVITVGGNPGDVILTTSSDPDSGFAGAASTTLASSAIQIQHTQGASGTLTVPITLTLDSPLVVTTSSSNALDLEFDLSHPAFIVAHQPPGGTLLWAVNFDGPVRHHPVHDLTKLVLRQLYGTVTGIASDGSSVTVEKDYPTLPLVSPETAVQSSQALTIDVDSTNGTLFYDVDDQSGPTKVTSFASLTGLANGAYLRIQARYQEDGTLVATRVWASSSFNNVWVSPEGHVRDVDASSITVTDEAGLPVVVDVNSATDFTFHGGTTAIGTGSGFLANLVRGFKVHVAVVDPLANPLVAQDVDIETAEFSGAISAADTSGFTYTHDFVRASDDYQQNLPYISAQTANGTDGSGNAITGFKYWPFAYPTELTLGSGAVTDFVAATTGPLQAYGFTGANWGDQATTSGWFAPWVGLLPSPVPLSSVTAGLSANDQFTIATDSGGTAYTVDVSASSGSATLVYQIDRSNGVLTVSPIDITTAGGLSTFTTNLAVGVPTKVYGVPQPDGTLRAYVVFYYTGTMPSD